MKKVRKILLLLIAASLLCAAVSCGKNCDNGHKDKNGDGSCDRCGASLVFQKPCEHLDLDGDGCCDRCGCAIIATDECEGHKDEDNNARCDKCGQSLINPDDDTPEQEVSFAECGIMHS